MSNANQRTKGNTKPSNSERAARLLTTNQVLSFSQASQQLSNVYSPASVSTETDAFKYDIDSDFKVIFKHLTKKDINTKLKALQDFTVLCDKKEPNELSGIASFWYRIYRKLTNVIDWRIRQEVHNAHFNFISKFDCDLIKNEIFKLASLVQGDTEANSTEVSFQNLVTMPAIMWTSCYDAYAQAAECSKKAFEYLFSTENGRIEFILCNYETVLNYCIYCIFDQIPIKLFYSNSLPPDSVKVFEEHILVTSLRGLSTLINELLCFHLNPVNDSNDELKNRVFTCLENIFIRLNAEFGINKFVYENENNTKHPNTDHGDENVNSDETFLSKKEKKKLKKEEKTKENAKKHEKGSKSQCKFWTYQSLNNNSIRVSLFHALNSIVRLTTTMYENSQLNESSIYSQLSTKNHLWFKFYRNNLFETTFKSLVNPNPEIKGISWLLGTHILSYPNLYNPWSWLNQVKFLQEILVPFISNGLRTVGGIIDFGLFNIGLQEYRFLYPEFFAKKYPHLSGLQLTTDNYSELDVLANVKLIIIFAQEFDHSQQQVSLEIYRTLLYSFNDAFARVILLKDADLLVELFFNLIYQIIMECFRSFSVLESKLNGIFDELFQTHLYGFIVKSFESNNRDLLIGSQIYLNLLLLVNNSAEFFKSFQDNKSLDDNEFVHVTNLLKFNVHKLYSSLFLLINKELDSYIDSDTNILFGRQSKFDLKCLLHFMNDSILYRLDGYFSSEYYYIKNNTNYEKNSLKLLHASNNVVNSSRKVNFGTIESKKVDDENDDNQLDITKWWVNLEQQLSFSFKLNNVNYKPLTTKTSEIYLLAEYGQLFDDVSVVLLKLILLFDKQLDKVASNQLELNEELFLIVLHIQHFLRFFNSQQLSTIFSKLLGNSKSSLSNFVETFVNKWIDVMYKYCCNLETREQFRLPMILGYKMIDLVLICLATEEESTRFNVIQLLLSQIKPFGYCLLLSHLNRPLPVSSRYSLTLKECGKYFNNSHELVETMTFKQIEVLFENSKFKNMDSDILMKTKVEPFLLPFPLLCCKIYSFLFERPQLLNQMKNFENTLIDFAKLFFEQMFTMKTLQDSCQKVLAKNAIAFWSFTLEELSKVFPKYEKGFESLVTDLSNTVIEIIVKRKLWNYTNYETINIEIKQFLDCLVQIFQNILPKLDSEDFNKTQKQFEFIQANFNRRIYQNVQPFSNDNIFGLIYELERDVSSRHKLFSIYDIFIGTDSNIQTLENLNDTNQFHSLLEEKFILFEQSLYNTFFQASIVNHLLNKVYLNPNYKEHCQFDLSSSLHLNDTNQVVSTIRSILFNMYQFDRYLNLCFYQKSDNIKHFQLKNVFNNLRNEIESIISTLKIEAKKENNLLIRLICFLIQLDDKDLYSFSYTDYILNNFFPNSNWMELLNHIGLQSKLETSRLNCILMAHTKNVTKLNEILSQTLRKFESAAISESYNELAENETTVSEQKERTLFDWSKLPIEDVYQSLLIAAFGFYRLRQFKANEQTKEIGELEERLLNFLTLLTWGKLEKLFEPNIPQFSNPKYQTCLLISRLITDAVQCLDGTAMSEHFGMFLAILKLWVQTMYTSLPEPIENDKAQQLNVLLMSSEMLDTFYVFGQTSSNMSSENDSQLELIESWRNFLAFDSFNMLLPLFVVLNNSPNRNFVEAIQQKRLIQIMDYVDIECLKDISSLELNQYLLMYPEEKLKSKISLETMLNRFIENAHLSESKHFNNRSKATTFKLTPSNPYYEYLLNYASPLLLHCDQNWSLGAFQILSIMLHDLPWAQKSVQRKRTPEDDGSLLLSGIDSALLNEQDIRLCPPGKLSKLLEKLDQVTEYVLADYEFGQSVMIDSNSDVYNYTFAYLLVWLLYLHLMDPFPVDDSSEARADLVAFLIEQNLHGRLFDNLFHLMLNLEEHEETNSGQTENISQFLEKISDLKDVQNLRVLIGEQNSYSLSKLALCVYYQILQNLPNLLRSWFGNLKPQQKEIIDDFTIRNFSGLLIEKELNNFKLTDREKFGNIVIRTSKKVNEITAVYSLREISFGIRFNFKNNYPLTAVGIECFNRSGVSEDRCRKWIHRLTTFFTKQNYSILNGIILLRPNMDKFFEDIEECMICLFVLYGATSDLPRFKCPQCRKKFHWACIRKWFQTNSSSSCPQCKFEFH
ncbi:listerin E3 ubiquitin protein ligase 1 [Blomia tropicalis]|nr:listerin E3 ubiquitin protein ligase 1 [Blomia tropicalis]